LIHLDLEIARRNQRMQATRHPKTDALGFLGGTLAQESLVILMIEEEQPEGLSARKLVVETAKHNVLSAYNARDGIELLRRFPAVSAIMVHARLLGETPDLLQQVSSLSPGKPIILASPYADDGRPEAKYVVDSHRPHDLVKLLGSGELQPR
jgi:response regulator RpfG family c-di-GMP phosphodiesterase